MLLYPEVDEVHTLCSSEEEIMAQEVYLLHPRSCSKSLWKFNLGFSSTQSKFFLGPDTALKCLLTLRLGR